MVVIRQRDLEFESLQETPRSAPDIAAAAALLEIGDRLGLLDLLTQDHEVCGQTLAARASLPKDRVIRYLEALEAAALIEEIPDRPGMFRTAPDFVSLRHQSGYVSWALNANRPFIEHAREFVLEPDLASPRYQREGRQVAVTSAWMGSLAFYPAALNTILSARPRRVADLGAGAGRLLIEVLMRCPDASGVALDINPGACHEAARAAERAGVRDRLVVLERPIQSIATDPSSLHGVDVIHAGFVFHDMIPDEDDVADAVLRQCRNALPPDGKMVITEAIPYVRNDRERRFSAIVTYFHQEFMGRKLLDEKAWEHKLLSAGFSDVQCVAIPFPTGRLFVARG